MFMVVESKVRGASLDWIFAFRFEAREYYV